MLRLLCLIFALNIASPGQAQFAKSVSKIGWGRSASESFAVDRDGNVFVNDKADYANKKTGKKAFKEIKEFLALMYPECSQEYSKPEGLYSKDHYVRLHISEPEESDVLIFCWNEDDDAEKDPRILWMNEFFELLMELV